MRSTAATIAYAHDVGTYPRGYCLRFVRTCWEVGPLYASAIEAWNGARYKHPGDRTPPVGAPCYYQGGQYGHIVLFCPPGHKGIRSTDCPSATVVSDAELSWCEQAWGYRYLGWTEDLNGIRVIEPEEEDDMKPEDWERLRRIVSEEVAQNNVAAADAVWAEKITVTQPNGDKVDKASRQLLRETWQKVSRLLGAS